MVKMFWEKLHFLGKDYYANIHVNIDLSENYSFHKHA